MGKDWNSFVDDVTNAYSKNWRWNGNHPSKSQKPSADGETVVYNGTEMPRWLALDLADVRVAIMVYGEGMSQEEVEEHAFRGLKCN